MANENNSESFKSALKGVLKSRLDGIGDAAKQSLSDVGGNVTASIRTSLGLARDENTSFLKTSSDPDAPLYEVVASNEGKNAKVTLWSDRIEWEKGRGISASKVLLGISTLGKSLALTGIRGNKDGFATLPISAISGISLRKDGLNHQIVSVATAAGSIDFRLSRQNAADFRVAIVTQMQKAAESDRRPEVSREESTLTSVIPSHDLIEQLEKLAALRDRGIISDEEFQIKKTQILDRL